MKKTYKNFLLKIKPIKYYVKGRNIYNNSHFIEVAKKSSEEISKKPSRTEIINYLLSLNSKTNFYLEIGVRNPSHNFNNINATNKFSVDPGLEYDLNPVDFRMTSNEFFQKLSNSEILSKDIKFDVIFIDGLHLAEQVQQDIANSMKFIRDDGFILLHDCNPSSEWHAREYHSYFDTPAEQYWNGTTWKAFLKWRCSPLVNSCCIDSDWGVGVLSKNQQIGKHIECNNDFYEFHTFDKKRKESLNLINYETFKNLISLSSTIR